MGFGNGFLPFERLEVARSDSFSILKNKSFLVFWSIMEEITLFEELSSVSMANNAITYLIAMSLTIIFIPRLWISSPIGAIAILAAIAIVNSTLWDANLFFNIPDSLSVTAIKLFFANGVLFWILVKLLPGIEVKGILPALIAPIVLTFISSLLRIFVPNIDWISIIQALFHSIIDFKNSITQESVK